MKLRSYEVKKLSHYLAIYSVVLLNQSNTALLLNFKSLNNEFHKFHEWNTIYNN